jgi:hypothetical protein
MASSASAQIKPYPVFFPINDHILAYFLNASLQMAQVVVMLLFL